MLYVGLQAVHVDGAVVFALYVPRRNRWLLSVTVRWPHALLQLHQPGHIGGNQLVFEPRGRRPEVGIVATVHQGRGIQDGFGLADQRHLGVDRWVGGKEAGRGVVLQNKKEKNDKWPLIMPGKLSSSTDALHKSIKMTEKVTCCKILCVGLAAG